MDTQITSGISVAPQRAPERRDLADYCRVRAAIEFLTDHWKEHPDLDQLAANLGMSPGHCQKFFKAWCGLSPKEFGQAIAIEHARALLEDSASVLDTAFEVGLSGPGRLHDLFVTHEAMTPGDYKRKGEGLDHLVRFPSVPVRSRHRNGDGAGPVRSRFHRWRG